MSEEIYIGTSGWSYPEWKGMFYPKGLKQADFLSFYTTRFNCVEVNSSFYHIPQLKTVENWVRQTPEDFRFAVKMYRGVTHFSKLLHVESLLSDFYARLEPLKSRCGAVLVQLPPSLSFSEWLLLDFIRSIAPYQKYAPVVLEPRHASWFNSEVSAILDDAGVSIVWHDYQGADIHWEIHAGELIYLRLHGWPELFVSGYTTPRLKEVAERIRPFVGQKKVWVFFNNTAAGHAIANAEELRKLVTRDS